MFCVCRKKLEDDCVAARHRCIQIHARVLAYNAFVLYNIRCLLSLQLNAFGVVAGSVFGKRWDLGSIPRSPYNFHIIFPKAFLCSIPSARHHEPHRSKQPGVIKADLKAQKARVPCAQSKRAIGNPRKSNELRTNGP